MARPRRRRGAHLRPQHPAIFDSAAHRAAAKRADVSHSRAGREVERAGSGVGDPILLCVRPSNHPETFELAGHIVGLCEDGFAVEYEEPGQAIGQWIDALQTAEPTASPPAAEPTGSAS